ncbi:hypothetical protein HOLleu_29308 [Holothuria leucospilota]|uniref:Uncharacterized protein n=1 Tax=Holothuria leucospilota TaxID=206669 RepID=A0A9Q1BNJ5_HOLLE|nr:hypothetical protein HOLleu_29308 [Holothuria leucospilota]
MRAQETPNIQRQRRLEDKVDHLLKNEDVDDDVRAKLYQEALRRQRVHHKQIPSMKDVMSPVNDEEEHHVSDDAIIASVPTKQSFEPRGHETLSHWLADLNIPEELVGNPERRKAIQRLRDSEEVYAVASHLSTPPQTPKTKGMRRQPLRKLTWEPL